MVEKDAVSKDFRKQVLGYGLTTAEIVYRRPDSALAAANLRLAGLRPISEFSGVEGFPRLLGKIARGSALRSHRRAFETHQARRTARRRWRVSAALIQLEQLRREREKLKTRISAPEHILRRGDLTARPVKRFQARAIAQKPALHRSMNRQAFVSRAVGGGVATESRSGCDNGKSAHAYVGCVIQHEGVTEGIGRDN